MRQNPHGGDIYTKKCRVDFSVNVNPLGTPESVKEAVRKSAESVEQYPDALCRDLTRALSEKEQLPEENILFANGAAELIFALTQALRPKKALIAAPGFAEYEAALSAAGCFIRMYPLQKEKGFLLQDDFCDDLTDDLDLVFLCNPNNPTGLTIPQELLLKILDNCRERNIYLVLDECFIEFLPEPEKVTMQGKLDEYPNLLILRAFTKIYAMPGLRLGYLLCSDEDLLDRISRSMQSDCKGKQVWFTRLHETDNGAFLREDGMLCMAENGVVTPFLAQKDVKLRGLHNIENLLAAAAAVWGEVPVEVIQKVGSTFTGVEHRIEPVRVLDGVTYYNDSIGTSPTRTIAGLRSFDQKVILIAGGYDKHIPYEPLAPEITAHVKNLVLMGATGPRIEKAVREDPNFNEAELPIQHADNMQHAVELARACAKPGDIIILSPASASFDLYPNFEVRGREFKSIVNALK